MLARLFACLALAASPLPAMAAGPGGIAVEFNDLQPAEKGCRAVFVLNNGLDKPLADLTLRVVAFDKDQRAKLFLSLSTGALPQGKTRVLRFDLGDNVACTSIGRLVLDDVTKCEGAGLDPASCLAAIRVTTRAGVPFEL
jgi:hypothetical protein